LNTLRKAASRGPELPAFRRILCALDLAQPTPGALGLAGLIAQQFAADMETLYVSPADAEPEAELRLQRMLGTLQPNVTGSAHVVSGSPARAISDRAATSRRWSTMPAASAH